MSESADSSEPIHGYDDVLAELKEFIESRFLPDSGEGIETDSPLLQLGILTSLNTTELIAHIQDRYGLFMPPEYIVGRNFKSLDTITKLVVRIQTDPAAMA